MAALDVRAPILDAGEVIAAAAREGFELVVFESPEGATIWEWRRGSEPRPQFVTRRVALVWMQELLTRARAPFATP